jgi:hypothetical protein
MGTVLGIATSRISNLPVNFHISLESVPSFSVICSIIERGKTERGVKKNRMYGP